MISRCREHGLVIYAVEILPLTSRTRFGHISVRDPGNRTGPEGLRLFCRGASLLLKVVAHATAFSSRLAPRQNPSQRGLEVCPK